MAIPANEIRKLHRAKPGDKYSVFVANDQQTKQACYRLRYDVFSNEMGADVRGQEEGLDKDRFDDHCLHLVVYDNQTNDLIATTRLLDNDGRQKTGMFYSESEFDLGNIIDSDAKFMEVGRTCIHPDYRRGAALAMLWQGIARLVVDKKIDYLIGCASIPLANGDKYINAVMQHIYRSHYTPESLRVRPLVPLRLNENCPQPDDVILPTLLKGYLRQGALICGEPYWDAAFGVADVFVLLECGQITSRYSKHFIDRIQ